MTDIDTPTATPTSPTTSTEPMVRVAYITHYTNTKVSVLQVLHGAVISRTTDSAVLKVENEWLAKQPDGGKNRWRQNLRNEAAKAASALRKELEATRPREVPRSSLTAKQQKLADQILVNKAEERASYMPGMQAYLAQRLDERGVSAEGVPGWADFWTAVETALRNAKS